MPYWVEKARFQLRSTLGLTTERHRVTVIGLWCNDEGCYGEPEANGIPDLELRYLVQCDWCGERLGEFTDPADAIRVAYEHSPYVDRGLFHRSKLHAEEAMRRRRSLAPSGRFTTHHETTVGTHSLDSAVELHAAATGAARVEESAVQTNQAAAEVAFAKSMGWDDWTPDEEAEPGMVRGYHVQWTPDPHAGPIVHDEADEDARYVPVTGQPPALVVHGWTTAREARERDRRIGRG